VLLIQRRPLGAMLGYLGASISLMAYGWYAALLLSKEVDTNIVTWGLWSFEATLSFFIYKSQTRGDFPKYVEELIAAIGCITVTVLLIGRAWLTDAILLAQTEWSDWASAIFCLAVLRIYLKNIGDGNDSWMAARVFHGVIILSAIPIVRSTIENPSDEPLWPWVLWAVGFAFQSLCILLRRGEGKIYRVILTPINYGFWHAAIAIIIVFSAT
jgi:hypothetical protein